MEELDLKWEDCGRRGQKGLQQISQVVSEKVDWLLRPYIPKRKITILEGDPGVGKSHITLAIAAAVSVGGEIMGKKVEAGNVLLFCHEDGTGDTVKPRLETMGADQTRIYATNESIELNDQSGPVSEYLFKCRPSLVIFDPISSYFPPRVDMYRANQVRPVMAWLQDFAERFDCAVILVRHLTKGAKDKAIYKGAGSIDFVAACRSALLVGCEASNPDNRAIVHIKSNLSEKGPSIGYTIENGSFRFTGKSDLTAEQIIAPDRLNEPSKIVEAEIFLKNLLENGPVESNEIFEAGNENGISKRTIYRAKDSLKIKAEKKGDKWQWVLPDKSLEKNG